MTNSDTSDDAKEKAERAASMGMYILDKDSKPIQAQSPEEWSTWYEANANTDAMRVSRDTIGKVFISTVFLSLCPAMRGETPELWETMIFGGEHDNYQNRYTSKEDAIAGHKEAVALVKKDLDKNNK